MKRVRPARHYQHPRAPIRRLADEAIPGVARAFAQTLRLGRRLLDVDKLKAMIAQGHYEEAASICNWEHQREAMRRPVGLLGQLWQKSGQHGARKINGLFNAKHRPVRYGAYKSADEPLAVGMTLETYLMEAAVQKDAADLFEFNLFDPETETLVRAYQDALISSLDQQQRASVLKIIMAGVTAGLNPDDIVDSIRRVIGLTPSQAAAVEAFRYALENGEAFRSNLLSEEAAAALAAAASDNSDRSNEEQSQADQDQIDQLSDDYADRQLNYRAQTIAQTETTRAASLGLQSAYRQASDRGVFPISAVTKRWQISLDEKTCFPAGTMVSVPGGWRPIEALRAGEFVWSHRGPRLVAATASRSYEKAAVLVIAGARFFISTLDHPIFANGRWVEACEIKPGDVLNAVGHELVDVSAVAQFEFADPDGCPALGEELRVASGVLGGIVPIDPIDLYRQLCAQDGKVEQVAPDAVLLVKVHAVGQGNSDGLLWESFAVEPSIAAVRAKASVSVAWQRTKGFAAAPAFNHVGRAAAGLRAMLSAAILGLHEALASPRAVAEFGDRQAAGPRADFVAVGVGTRNAIGPAAPWAGLANPLRLVWDIAHGAGKVFDIEVQGAHSFYAGGLLVHNCPICLSIIDNNPDGVGLDEEFDSDDGPIDAPPGHPNCRCSIEMVTNLDDVADPDSMDFAMRLRKYSDDEARDDHGRWTSGGGDGGSSGREFFSGNTDDLSFGAAVDALASPGQMRVEAMSHDVDRSLGLRARDTGVVGAWSDGAENSVMTTVDGSDWDKLRVSAAMKGSLANQKAVLAFQEDAAGSDTLLQFDARGSLGEIHDGLLKDGLAFHTLIPTSGGARVVIVAGSEDDATNTAKAASRYGAEVSFRQGRAEFIGVGGDGTREQAQQTYAGIIDGSGVQGTAGVWQGLRDRWGSLAKVAKRLLAWIAAA